MKTFADLKIGDTVYEVTGYELANRTITNLGKRGVCVKDYCSRKEWNEIDEETFTEFDYGHIFYCNQSEALMALKEKIRKSIDNKAAEIEKATREMLDLKEIMYKYL